MNSNKQAQQGFKTFILTLVISLIVFSAIYYIVNSDAGSYNDSFVSDNAVIEAQTDEVETSTLGAASEREMMASSEASEQDEKKSVFEELATDKMYIEAPAVLADTDDTTEVETTATTTEEVPESTVPDTGISNPTFGILMTIVAISLFGYIMFIGPRNIALNKFEKDILDDLD